MIIRTFFMFHYIMTATVVLLSNNVDAIESGRERWESATRIVLRNPVNGRCLEFADINGKQATQRFRDMFSCESEAPTAPRELALFTPKFWRDSEIQHIGYSYIQGELYSERFGRSRFFVKDGMRVFIEDSETCFDITPIVLTVKNINGENVTISRRGGNRMSMFIHSPFLRNVVFQDQPRFVHIDGKPILQVDGSPKPLIDLERPAFWSNERSLVVNYFSNRPQIAILNPFNSKHSIAKAWFNCGPFRADRYLNAIEVEPRFGTKVHVNTIGFEGSNFDSDMPRMWSTSGGNAGIVAACISTNGQSLIASDSISRSCSTYRLATDDTPDAVPIFHYEPKSILDIKRTPAQIIGTPEERYVYMTFRDRGPALECRTLDPGFQLSSRGGFECDLLKFGQDGPALVSFSGDAKRVIMASAKNHRVAFGVRDVASGQISWTEFKADENAANPHHGALDCDISPDGKTALVLYFDSLAFWRMEKDKPDFRFVKNLAISKSGVGENAKRQIPYDAVLSHDGAHAFVTFPHPGAVLAFSVPNGDKGGKVVAQIDAESDRWPIRGARSIVRGPDPEQIILASDDFYAALLLFETSSGR